MVTSEIIFYDDSGNEICMPLNKLQTQIIVKILGIKFYEKEYSFYSDNTLIQLCEYQGNPLRLKEKAGE